MDAFHYLLNGFATALQWQNIIFAFVGVLIGTVVGVLPGIGPISGVALLIPVTASLTGGLPPEEAATSAIILLAGVYYGAMYGGSTTSILLNTPGESSSVVTVLDGYPMAKQGRAGVALAIAAIGSFVAGIVSLVGLVFLAEPLSDVALKLSPADEFSLMILGLCALSGLAGKSVTKALIMTVFGLLLATIGMDNVSGVARFTFDMPELYSGLEFLTIAVGVFALGEVFKTILERDANEGEIAKISRILPTKQDLKESAGPIIRGSLVGFFKGIVPGSGATLASFLAYLLEKKISKNPEKFGKGAIAGVAAPESANNAASGGAMIPLLTLGIPGTGTTAVLMGALIMYNVQPGPLLFDEHPTIAWGLIASMFIGNLMLLILNMPLVKVFAKLIETPPKYLIPMIVAISIFGVYAVRVSVFDLVLLLICGVVGYFLAKNDFPMAPLVLGLVLGPMIENNLRRALTTSNGDFSIFIEKPVSLVFLIIAVLWISVPLIMKMRGKKVVVNVEG
ncbi:tripartite tricarboxylate transporter permease [Brevibacillus centrosporus]|uniref:Putative tricarboxylic transport membrane protein n=1 Tax=Brevibacillus centrosporus TaxID=54910 RepID=A0A1I3LT19_9BACL|nr:tripartite tricarboxylate transporter permease [Brevibacillus centrosporus]MEC2131318.1 tripartite tricarboxylate transporter permease [Brevibacillus centrosporus]MED1951242.1 tripartite tricarboxylate transporter permease [Brevibacillus centrosporus]MED4906846.1 tripartite tricarboxylate transporter permease [Brevibacillus centrosporus]RNB72649.1 tripartite tricarboxylate transporter permease [Brevibacillus centrosporus]SFI87881.1 putative tricarboxylic transport membrane protein [Brevibac